MSRSHLFKASSLPLLLFFSLCMSCGSPSGRGNNNSGGDNGAADPDALPLVTPTKSTAGQTLVTIGNLVITPSQKSAEPVFQIEDLLKGTSIMVEGYREIILYGYEPDQQNGIPNCKLSNGTLMVLNPDLAADVYFGMDGTFLKGSYANDISELSRHLVSGKIMTVFLKDSSPGSINQNDAPIPTIDQSTCKGSLNLKVVGVLY